MVYGIIIEKIPPKTEEKSSRTSDVGRRTVNKSKVSVYIYLMQFSKSGASENAGQPPSLFSFHKKNSLFFCSH